MSSDFVGLLILLTIAVLFILLVLGMLLQWACKLVAGFMLANGLALKAASRAFLTWMVIVKIVDCIEGDADNLVRETAFFGGLVVGFLVQSAIYTKMLTIPETGPVSFGKACLISLMQLIFFVLVYVMFSMVSMALVRA